MTKLPLLKPLAFFDLETTSADIITARIVQIAIIRLDVEGGESRLTFIINPGVPIPAESSAVHGLYDDDVKDKPSFDEVATEIYEFIKDSDIGGFNSNRFDVPILAKQFNEQELLWPLPHVEFIDAYKIYIKDQTRQLKDAYKHYTGEELVNAHDAMADVSATVDVFIAQWFGVEAVTGKTIPEVALYCNDGKPKGIDLENKFSYDNEGNIRFGFGQYKGEFFDREDPLHMKYMDWVKGTTSTFSDHVKKIAQAIVDGEYNRK